MKEIMFVLVKMFRALNGHRNIQITTKALHYFYLLTYLLTYLLHGAESFLRS